MDLGGLMDSVFGTGDEVEIEGDGADVREQIAETAVNAAVDFMYSSIVNNGQETLVEAIENDFTDQAEQIADGDFEEVESDHPEAIGYVTAVANVICEHAANICGLIKEISEALNF